MKFNLDGQTAELALPAMRKLFPAGEYHALVDYLERPEYGAQNRRVFRKRPVTGRHT